ncbi:Glycosyltransferase involved in cell wall bisynthesis [Fibrobacter sp. UWB16]|uniref:glycosyltransferase family 2 protein n=1 Tax=Fibrobacter sp. UWB16 TaxID=1945874 RepID=UPI000BDD7AEB|nr:glycosyltransferase [Fibrobacter sp. UWB16]SOD11541.1 Glycosyltransferase involved in cell wall bisynthesis [Fibrobacter sp. UWB16]
MMNHPNISVIVAVYQAENFIRRCLDCLQRQTLKNFEVLLVDDGSFDQSGAICDEYAAHDCRFKTIHKGNGGVATARQVGFDNAKGDFFIHVDPDDWVDSTMLEELLKKALIDDADVVICDYYLESGKQRKYYKQEPTKLNHDAYFYDLVNEKLHGACWNKLVRTECFRKYGIKFDLNMNYCEDLFVNLKLAEKPVKISYLPKAFYHYYQNVNHNSLIQQHSMKRLNSLKNIISWLEQKKDPFVENGVAELKKSSKWTAFLICEFTDSDFKGLYPEVNKLFNFNLHTLGHWEFFITIALFFSLPFARRLFKAKVCITTMWNQ